VDREAGGEKLIPGEGPVIKDQLETGIIITVEEILEGHGIFGTEDLDHDIVPVPFHLQLVSGGTLEDEGVGGGSVAVGNDVVAMAGTEAVDVIPVTAV
ncbi:hypothetical protein, partial [Lelliottia sp. WAP21]|uniref:hypothetical protein n=1 Tax=Lelliottia sp. WAP21 TaxID=2877426 RepID=UPI001F2F3288